MISKEDIKVIDKMVLDNIKQEHLKENLKLETEIVKLIDIKKIINFKSQDLVLMKDKFIPLGINDINNIIYNLMDKFMLANKEDKVNLLKKVFRDQDIKKTHIILETMIKISIKNEINKFEKNDGRINSSETIILLKLFSELEYKIYYQNLSTQYKCEVSEELKDAYNSKYREYLIFHS